MKVIDLLNKILEDTEQLPKRIKIANEIYTLGNDNNYYDKHVNSLTSKLDNISFLKEDVKVLDEEIFKEVNCIASEIPPWFDREELIRVVNENFEVHNKALMKLVKYLNEKEDQIEMVGK